MTFTDIFIIAVGLSMDAFAVAICKGLNMKKLNLKHGFTIAFYFGLFQALMPLIGWLLGSRFQHIIMPVDHWVAFILLTIIGFNMLRESFSKKGECGCDDNSCAAYPNIEKENGKINIKELLTLAIATSIDALVVGITFGIQQINIVKAISTIGIVTFIMCVIGVGIGHFFGAKYEKKATLAGGSILILMGSKILVEHLFFL